MNYLAKLKQKLANEKTAEVKTDTRFGTFDTSLSRHVPGLGVQPMVYIEPKITNTLLSVKSTKSPLFEVERAKCATVATLRGGLDNFRLRRPSDVSRFRHDQACWAAEMFLQEWGSLAAEFGWMPSDVFDTDALAHWLETEIVTALGPEQAVTESGRAYDRVTRLTWVNPSRTLQ